MLTPVAPSTSNINDRLQCRRHLKAEEESGAAAGTQDFDGRWLQLLYTVGVEPPSMRKVVPVMKSVSGWLEANRGCNIHRLPKPTDGLAHDVFENILLAKLRVVTPLPLRVSTKNLSSCGV